MNTKAEQAHASTGVMRGDLIGQRPESNSSYLSMRVASTEEENIHWKITMIQSQAKRPNHIALHTGKEEAF